VLFGNVSRRPFSNNLSGIVRAFARATRLRVIEPSRFPGFVSSGGAPPVEVPRDAVREAVAEADPELVICLAGALFVSAEARKLFGPDTVFMGFAASDPIGLAGSFAIAPEFDLFYTQDPHSVPVYRRKGLAVRAYLPAIDTGEFVPLEREKEWDVAFVGKWTAYRDALIRALSTRFEIRVFTHTWETQWSVPVRPPLDTPEEVCEAMARSRLALECALVDDPRAEDLQDSVRITNRPQIAAACGVPSLVEDFDLLPRFFSPGSEVEPYTGPVDLVEKTERLLADHERRNEMGRRAMERVRRDHTWDQRVEGFLADVRERRAARAVGR
jgi:spore maturation protein CgeB